MNLVLFALGILAKFSSAGANEPRGPRNIACLSNTQVIMTCAAPESDSFSIDWRFYSRYNIMYPTQLLTNNTGSNISTNYLMIKVKNGESLVINSVQLRDSGVYYCVTINATGEESTVGSHVTVLASDPTCDVKNLTVMENDYILLQCTVIYDGLWRPVMEWTQLGFLGQEKINNESIFVNVTEPQQYASMTASLQILAKSYHNNVSFVCKTYFDYREMLEKKHVISNTPEYKHVWESPKINVLYGPRNVSIFPAFDTFHPGDKLSCSAFGNPQPEYEWIDNETVFYVGWQIEIVQSMIRNEPYVFMCKAHNSVSESFSDITFTVKSPCVRRIRDDPMFTINHSDVQMAAAISHVREDPVNEGISSAVYADIQDINISPIYQQAEESSAHYMELSERNHAQTLYERLRAL